MLALSPSLKDSGKPAAIFASCSCRFMRSAGSMRFRVLNPGKVSVSTFASVVSNSGPTEDSAAMSSLAGAVSVVSFAIRASKQKYWGQTKRWLSPSIIARRQPRTTTPAKPKTQTQRYAGDRQSHCPYPPYRTHSAPCTSPAAPRTSHGQPQGHRPGQTHHGSSGR